VSFGISLFKRKPSPLLERKSSSSSKEFNKASTKTKNNFSEGPNNKSSVNNFENFEQNIGKVGDKVLKAGNRSMGAEVAYRITKFIAKELFSSMVEFPVIPKVFDQMFDEVFEEFSPETNVIKQETKRLDTDNKHHQSKEVIKILLTAFKESLPNIKDLNDPFDLEKLKGFIIDTKQQKNDQFRVFTTTLISKINENSQNYKFTTDQKNQLLKKVQGIVMQFNEIQWNRDGENASLIGGSIKSDDVGQLLTFLSQSTMGDEVNNPMHSK